MGPGPALPVWGSSADSSSAVLSPATEGGMSAPEPGATQAAHPDRGTLPSHQTKGSSNSKRVQVTCLGGVLPQTKNEANEAEGGAPAARAHATTVHSFLPQTCAE